MTTAAAPQPDPRIAAYVAEVGQPGIPYISRSHVTLSRLYIQHGAETVHLLLAQHWAAVRAHQHACAPCAAEQREVDRNCAAPVFTTTNPHIAAMCDEQGVVCALVPQEAAESEAWIQG